MPKAFCPGHITCFFSPGDIGGDLSSCGSTGLGIRLSAGATVTVEETASDRVSVVIDGVPSPAPVTVGVIREMMPGRGAEVTVENGLPLGEGFGMSAAGAIAAALCAEEISGGLEADPWNAAHRAEITGGGGRGDVAAIQCASHVPVRLRQGIGEYGQVVDSGISFPVLTVAVLGPKMNTGKVLSDPASRQRIFDCGRDAMRAFDGTKGSLFNESNRFSERIGLESAEISDAIRILGLGRRRAAMCMLGNSIFSDAPMKMVADVLPEADVFAVMSTREQAHLISRRGPWTSVRAGFSSYGC